MTVIYRNIHFYNNQDLDRLLTNTERGVLKSMKTAIVEVDHNTVTNKLTLSTQAKDSYTSIRSELAASTFSNGFIELPGRLVSLDEIYYKLSTLGTEADLRALSLMLQKHYEDNKRTFVFVHRLPDTLNLGLNYRPNMVAYTKFQNNRQTLSDWLNQIEFPHTFD